MLTQVLHRCYTGVTQVLHRFPPRHQRRNIVPIQQHLRMPPNLLQRPILPHIILCDIREHHVHIRIQPLIPPPRQPSAYARAGERATQTDGDEAYTAEETTHRECTHQLLVTLHQYYSSRATREPCETKREENVRTIINRINAPPTPTTHPRHTARTPYFRPNTLFQQVGWQNLRRIVRNRRLQAAHPALMFYVLGSSPFFSALLGSSRLSSILLSSPRFFSALLGSSRLFSALLGSTQTRRSKFTLLLNPTQTFWSILPQSYHAPPYHEAAAVQS